jgi:hypothetical protein
MPAQADLSAVCSRCCGYETMTRQDGDACTQSRSATRAERAGFIIRACADQARLMDTGTPARPLLTVEEFTLNLIDTVLAILQAPTSITPPEPLPTKPTR